MWHHPSVHPLSVELNLYTNLNLVWQCPFLQLTSLWQSTVWKPLPHKLLPTISANLIMPPAVLFLNLYTGLIIFIIIYITILLFELMVVVWMLKFPQLSAYYQYLLSDPGLQIMLSLSGCVFVPKPGLDQKHIRQVTRYFVNQDQREGTDNKYLIGEPETSELQYWKWN